MSDDCRFCRGLEQYRSVAESGSGNLSGLVVANLPAAVAVLSPDQYYRGYTVVVAKTHATELYHLSESECSQFLRDMLAVAKAIAAAFSPRKMNYELLGNTVPHLHWHLVPRYDWDPNPTRPIWEHLHDEVLLDTNSYEELAQSIRTNL